MADDIHMADDAFDRTTKCGFGFKCRGEDTRLPICTVVNANGEPVLFVNGDYDFNCAYRVTLSKRETCSSLRTIGFTADNKRA